MWLVAATAADSLAPVAAGCGGGGGSNNNSNSTTSSSGGNTTSSSGKTFPNFRIAYDTGIDFLDPALSYTVQGWSIMWNVYLPLLGYKHVNGPDGATLVPYLAKDLPKVSSDGKTYEFTLRKGLKYSDGTPVKASDFPASVERMLKLNWGGKSFVTGYVTGANAYDTGKAKSISGITADDATGKITIKLDKAYGAFANVLA